MARPKTHDGFVLNALHAAVAASDGTHEGRSTLSEAALRRIAADFHVPLTELCGAVEFYHYLDLSADAPSRPRLGDHRCNGPACSMVHAGAAADAAPCDEIACPGLCDQAALGVSLRAGHFFAGDRADAAFEMPRPVASEEPVFRHLRAPRDAASLSTYQRHGGYRHLLALVNGGIRPEAVEATLDTIEAAGLRGRGGAGFPVARKWRAVRSEAATEKWVVCNADEGEPGTFKDRPILHLAPHLLLEAMAVAAVCVGAERGVIYLRYEYPHALNILESAIAEAEREGVLGASIGGSGVAFHVEVCRGAGSYVCGEETALLNSLEGRMPWPRPRPPYPTTRGLFGTPTLVHNVETLAVIPSLLSEGADWYRALGRGTNSGTKLYSVSGRVQRPGNYELPFGITARELIFDHAGGPLPGHTITAFTLGGISGGLLGRDALDMPLDYEGPLPFGAALGSGGAIVLDDTTDLERFVGACLRFYAAESCGRCFPCRVGTTRLRERMDAVIAGRALDDDARAEVDDLCAVLRETSACGLGPSAALLTAGWLQQAHGRPQGTTR